jgi:hypothetical protein
VIRAQRTIHQERLDGVRNMVVVQDNGQRWNAHVPSDTDLPNIDWSGAPFPSNRLTVGQLRKAVGSYDPEDLQHLLYMIAATELLVAENAVVEASGAPEDVGTALSRILKEDHSKELSELYTQVGLATGPHEVTELIRQFQAWAMAEGRKRGFIKST